MVINSWVFEFLLKTSHDFINCAARLFEFKKNKFLVIESHHRIV